MATLRTGGWDCEAWIDKAWNGVVLVVFADLCLFVELPKWTRVSQRLNPPGF